MSAMKDAGKLISSLAFVKVPEQELARLLGYPQGRAPVGPAAALATRARSWYGEHGRPWARCRYWDIQEADSSTVRLHRATSQTIPYALRRDEDLS